MIESLLKMLNINQELNENWIFKRGMIHEIV